MESATRARLTRKSLWIRALYMLLFMILLGFAKTVVGLSVVFQFVTILFTGRANEPVLRFCNNLSAYVADVYRFLTFNAERRPFPFSDWPDEEIGDDRWMAEEDGMEEVQEESESAERRFKVEDSDIDTGRYDDTDISDAEIDDAEIDDTDNNGPSRGS